MGRYSKMMDEKFSILDTIRKESANHEVAITLSMGIAYGGPTLDQTGTTAQTNLDTALVRGGDQVVVKKPKMKRSRYFWWKNGSNDETFPSTFSRNEHGN